MTNVETGENTIVDKEKLTLEIMEDMKKVGEWVRSNDEYLSKNGHSMSKEELGKYVLITIGKLAKELDYKLIGPVKLDDILHMVIQQNRGVYEKQIGLTIDHGKFSVIARVANATCAK
jgi:hypothetical protein